VRLVMFSLELVWWMPFWTYLGKLPSSRHCLYAIDNGVSSTGEHTCISLIEISPISSFSWTLETVMIGMVSIGPFCGKVLRGGCWRKIFEKCVLIVSVVIFYPCWSLGVDLDFCCPISLHTAVWTFLVSLADNFTKNWCPYRRLPCFSSLTTMFLFHFYSKGCDFVS
jgi:hypothetical protein